MNLKNPPHPGLVVLQECIEPLGLSTTDAAMALGVMRNTLSELVNGKRGISPEMAVRLAKAVSGTEDGWLLQHAHYELAQVRRDQINVRCLRVACRSHPCSIRTQELPGTLFTSTMCISRGCCATRL